MERKGNPKGQGQSKTNLSTNSSSASVVASDLSLSNSAQDGKTQVLEFLKVYNPTKASKGIKDKADEPSLKKKQREHKLILEQASFAKLSKSQSWKVPPQGSKLAFSSHSITRLQEQAKDEVLEMQKKIKNSQEKRTAMKQLEDEKEIERLMKLGKYKKEESESEEDELERIIKIDNPEGTNRMPAVATSKVLAHNKLIAEHEKAEENAKKEAKLQEENSKKESKLQEEREEQKLKEEKEEQKLKKEKEEQKLKEEKEEQKLKKEKEEQKLKEEKEEKEERERKAREEKKKQSEQRRVRALEEELRQLEFELRKSELSRHQIAKVEKNDQTPDDIFGYQTMLHSPKHIFAEEKFPIIFESEIELKETDDEKDMTWLAQLSATEEKQNKKQENLKSERTDVAAHSFWLFWMFMSIGGRMPFHFFKNSDSAEPESICQMKKTGRHFYTFVVSTVVLIFLTLVSTFNLLLIIAEEEIKGEPHNQIEKLLYEKNKVTAIMFLASLTLASVSSIDVLIYGDSIAKYMTIWRKTLDEFNFKSSSWIITVTIIYIMWSILFFLLYVILFSITISDLKPSPFIEGIHLLTALVFRSFVPNVLIEIKEIPGQESEIQSSRQLWKYGMFIVCLNAYTLYCSRNFVIMVVLYAIGIRNMAVEWNFRLRLIFRQMRVKKSEHFLQNLDQSLTYQKMFDWHRKIVLLVEENSKVFSTILGVFYLALAFVLAGELLDLAIYTVGQERHQFNLNETAQIYDLENTSADFVYLCFNMSQTIGVFLFVSLLLAQTGIEVMNGNNIVTRHNYMGITSTRRRNFFMSLLMSFGARKPHILGAGGIFSIDRQFVLGFLAFFMYFFSVMIQTRHPRMLTLPIVLQCPPGSSKFCVNKKLVTLHEVGTHNDMSGDRSLKFLVLNKIEKSATTPIYLATTKTVTVQSSSIVVVPTSSPVVVSTTPPPRPDSCGNFPTNPNAKQKLVKSIRLPTPRGDHFGLCCNDNGDGKYLDNCNENKADVPAKCKVDSSNRYVRPFLFDDLEVPIQTCLNNQKLTDETDKTVKDICKKMHDCICGVNPTNFNFTGTLESVKCP